VPRAWSSAAAAAGHGPRLSSAPAPTLPRGRRAVRTTVSPHSTGVPESGWTRDRFRHTGWVAGAVLLVVVGCTASLGVAHALSQSNGERSRQAFVSASGQIAATLSSAIQREQELALGAGAFIVGNPQATQVEFLQWTAATRAFDQYPELLDLAEVTVVTAAQLPAFTAHEEADPSGPLSSDGAFIPSPPGNRPFYCFATVAQSRGQPDGYPAGIDYCRGELGPALLQTRDTGRSAYLPFGTGAGAELAVGTAIYRGGVTPSTVAARRAALIGWTGAQIRPSVVMDAALEGHPGMALDFRYGQGATAVTLRSGTPAAGAQSTTVDLHNGWQVKVFGSVNGGQVFADPLAVSVLLAGLILSLLLGALFFVLGTGRARAVALVRERTEQLRFLAFHDPLTGLANRALILDRAGQMLARSRREGTQVAALFVDLDNFKDINDTLGHEAGDRLLEAVGSRLSGALRAGDSVGRLGGDEFVVMVDAPSLSSGVAVVADRILALFDTPFDITGNAAGYTVSASIGIAEGDGGSADELLRQADLALYRAKEGGKQRALLFTSTMQEAVEEARTLERDLRVALQDGQFFLQYQPIFDLTSGVIRGVEALLRWRHPVRGVIQPDAFIPVLEANGLIVPVGKWVLDTACDQGARWLEQGHRIDLSVNLSGRQLEQAQIVDDVRSALETSGLSPDVLVLELTETSLMHDVETVVGRLELLKSLGLRLAIDDFGMGYSSISYLQQFPVDILKIDQSFVSRITDAPASAALVHTVVQLAKALGLVTVAEGIETEEQRTLLHSERVDYGQGYLVSRPVDAPAVGRLLDASAVPGAFTLA